MASEIAKETRVTEGHLVSIPAAIRHRLGIRPGDALTWELQGGRLLVRVRRKRRRGFADFRPFDFGRPTDATRDHDEVH